MAEPTYSIKQAIVLRTDLDMRKGKLVAQGAHAAIRAYIYAPAAVQEAWMRDGELKVALRVTGEADLVRLFVAAGDAGLPCSIVRDAGRTQIPAGTLTAIAIGPAQNVDVDAITQGLSLL